MPTITQTQSSTRCTPNDVTAPKRPTIEMAIAFDRAKDDAQVTSGTTNTRGAGRRDPAYIQLGNVEIGTRVEMINLSNNPSATFDKKNTVELPITGRDAKSRKAAVYLKQAQMNKLGIKPGDMFKIRLVDAAGNASPAVLSEFEGTGWARQRVIEDGQWVAGQRIPMLDGEGIRKNVIAKAVNDSRAPLLKEERMTIVTKGNGQKSVKFDRALEPRATVTVQNSRTGNVFRGTVDDDGALDLPLKDIHEGDPLVICVADNNGVQGKDIDVIYSSKCKSGKAKKLIGGLGARLAGVI